MPTSTEIHETPLRVRYAETDAAGIAHHSAYVAWLEVGRVEWMRAAGAAYADLERAGYTLPVIEMRIRYVSPARFDDELIIRTGLSDIRSRSMTFLYEVLAAGPRPAQLANGITRHICVRNGQVAPLPAEVRGLAERTRRSGRPPGAHGDTTAKAHPARA